MRVEVMQYYGLTQALSQAGYYETEHHQQLIKDIKGAVMQGRLIAVCGVVGSGKTVMLRRLQQILKDENRVSVAKSVSVEKHSIKLATLISALYYDLSQDKQVQIPKQGERRDRELQDLVKKGKRPVALFIDEAHDLNGHTLIGLKRLMEVVEDVGGRLSVILAGHPKLRNDLRRPTMEEIGYRTDICNLDGIAGSQRDYIQWLLGVCTGNKAESGEILTDEAIDILAAKLRTPLQVQLHLTLAPDGQLSHWLKIPTAFLKFAGDTVGSTVTLEVGLCAQELEPHLPSEVHNLLHASQKPRLPWMRARRLRELTGYTGSNRLNRHVSA